MKTLPGAWYPVVQCAFLRVTRIRRHYPSRGPRVLLLTPSYRLPTPDAQIYEVLLLLKIPLKKLELCGLGWRCNPGGGAGRSGGDVGVELLGNPPATLT